jgi:hypothetical protein
MDDGVGQFERTPTSDGAVRAPTVVGVWHATDRGATLRAEFRADGHYERSLRTGEDVRIVTGTYTLREEVLELQPAGQEERITLRCRFVAADTLELRDAKGGALRLTRGEP